MSAQDHYRVLGVSASAQSEELKRAYRRMLRASHPDLGGSPERFRVVQDAWLVLGNPQRRADYDSELVSGVRWTQPKRRAHSAGSAQKARQRPTEPPRVLRADSHGHPGGSARLLYLGLLRAAFVTPTAPTPPAAWQPEKRLSGHAWRTWATLCAWTTVSFAAVGAVVFLCAESLGMLSGNLQGLWSPLALSAAVSGTGGFVCALLLGVIRVLSNPNRGNGKQLRNDQAQTYAAAQQAYQMARQAYEAKLRRRPADSRNLLKTPYSEAAQAVASAKGREWLEHAVAQEATAGVLSPLGPDFSIWHDLVIGADHTRIDHLVVAPQGLILVESMTARGPVSVEFDALVQNGQAAPEVLTALRPRLAAIADQLGIAGVSAIVLVYPNASLVHTELQRVNGFPVPTFVVGAGQVADALTAGLPKIERGASWQIDRLRQSVVEHAEFA